MRKIHFSDHLEKRVAAMLDGLGIKYVHESEDKSQSLDFYLPKFDLYIEIKQYSSERTIKQLDGKDAILIQGKSAIRFLELMIEDLKV